MAKPTKVVKQFGSFAELAAWKRFEASKQKGGGRPGRLPPPDHVPGLPARPRPATAGGPPRRVT